MPLVDMLAGKTRLRASLNGPLLVPLEQFHASRNAYSYISSSEPKLLVPPTTISKEDRAFFFEKPSHQFATGQVAPPRSRISRRSDVFVVLLPHATGILFDRNGLLFGGNYLSQIRKMPDWLIKHESGYYPDFEYLDQLPVQKGTFAVYFDGNIHNYKHWWVDMLVPWHAINRRVGIPCQTLSPIPLNQMPTWQRASFDLMGINDIVEPPPGAEVMRLEEAVYAEQVGLPANPYDDLASFRTDILTKFGGVGQPKTRFYIKRIGGPRPIANEEEVEAAMRAHGFDIVVPELLGAEGQIALFRNAGFVVGNHGAAFGNMLFSPPGARFLEFMPDIEMRVHYWALAQGLGQQNGFVRCKALGTNFHGPLQVDVKQVVSLIEKMDTKIRSEAAIGIYTANSPIDTKWQPKNVSFRAFRYEKPTDRINICLFGHSNSVYRDGLAGGFSSHPGVKEFVNCSVGGSSCEVFPFLSEEIDFSIYDFCILEFACNDASLLGSSLPKPRIAELLRSAITQITRAGCVPILLILPVEKMFPTGEPIKSIYLNVAREMNIPSFDAYDYIDRLRASGSIEQSIFQDPMHINRRLARIISERLVNLLREARSSPAENTTNTSAGFNYVFRSYKVVSQETASVTAKFTSLLDVETIEIKIGSYDVKIDSAEEIVALAFDLAPSSGVMRLTGEGDGLSVRFTNHLFTVSPEKLMFAVWSLRRAIKGGAHSIRLDVVQDGPAEQTMDGRPYVEAPLNQLSLAGFVCRSAVQSTAYSPYKSSLQLDALISQQDIEVDRVALTSISNEQVIFALYVGVLRRPPDAEGLAVYSGMLNALILERGFTAGLAEVITRFLGSPEAKKKLPLFWLHP